MQIKTIIALGCLAFCAPAAAQTVSDTAKAFSLGEVKVFGNKHQFTNSEVDASMIKAADMQRASDALQWVPGLVMGETGGRGEASFTLRGFTSDNIPIYIDGIQMTAPYDGTVDVYRLGVGTLAKVDVQKSMSSLLLGGNTHGPSINLVTAQPTKPLELHFDLNTLWHSNFSLGGRSGKWFAQTSINWSHEENFRVPSDYDVDTKYIADHKRLNSRTKDFTWNTRLGFTPNATDEYVLGYMMVRARKNIPPYIGENGKPKFWRYPYWNKDEIYFHSSTRLSRVLTLRTKLFYDTFSNLLSAFDDFSFTTQKAKSSWNSYYDDYALGGNANITWATSQKNDLKLGFNYKNDVHRSHNEGEPEPKISEGTYSFVLEDEWRPMDALSMTASVGYFGHKGYSAEGYETLKGSKQKGIVDYPTSNDHEVNGLFAIDYHPVASQHVRFTASRSSRFARMKDRYSYKNGKSIPNPELGTENSINLDLSYEGSYGNLNWFASAYYNFLDDLMTSVTGVVADDPQIFQTQNKGKAQYRGFELGAGYNLSWLTARASYSSIDQQANEDHGLKFLYSPKQKANIFVELRPCLGIRLQGRMLVQDKSYSLTDGSAYSAGFARIDASVARKFTFHNAPSFDFKLGVLNLADRQYAFNEGYIQRGRTWYGSVAVDL